MKKTIFTFVFIFCFSSCASFDVIMSKKHTLDTYIQKEDKNGKVILETLKNIYDELFELKQSFLQLERIDSARIQKVVKSLKDSKTYIYSLNYEKDYQGARIIIKSKKSYIQKEKIDAGGCNISISVDIFDPIYSNKDGEANLQSFGMMKLENDKFIMLITGVSAEDNYEGESFSKKAEEIVNLNLKLMMKKLGYKSRFIINNRYGFGKLEMDLL